MSIQETKNNSQNNIASNNLLDSFTQNLKKCFLSVKYDKNSRVSKGIDNSKNIITNVRPNPKITRKKANSQLILNESTPIEFYYEIQDIINEDSKKDHKAKEIPKYSKQSIKKKENEKNEEKLVELEKNFETSKKKKQQNRYDTFWSKVKEYINTKNEHLNELRNKIKSETFIRNKDKCKSSKNLSYTINPKNRKPLYISNHMDEETLTKNLEGFYKYSQKEQKNEEKRFSKSCKNFSSENKFRKFYEDEMRWKEMKENKINNQRKIKKINNKLKYSSMTFRPKMDKKSIQLINERNRFINFMESNSCKSCNFNNNILINKRDVYQKYLVTIRPYMSFYYEKNPPFYRRNKSTIKKKRKNSVEIGIIHKNKGKNIKITKEEDENKSGMKSEKKIFKIFKPIKKNIVKKENKEDSDRKGKKSKIQNSKRWWNILNKKGFNKSKKIKNGIDVNNLYKVNVRDNLSWNKVCVNQVRARPFYKNIYETFL